VVRVTRIKPRGLPRHLSLSGWDYSMRSIGLLAVVTGTLLLASACSDGSGTPPPDNEPPVAGFTEVCTNLSCLFTDASNDPDGNTTITSRNWVFGDDATSPETSPTHAYAAAGTYTVALTVTDDEGDTGEASKRITVTAAPPGNPPPMNAAPTAGFAHSCAQAVCTFVSTSTDAAPGRIASSAWTFGDGGTADGNNPSHTYSVTAATEFTVTLTVTDNQGATAVATKTIAVNPAPPANQAPVARFTYSCAAAVCTFVNTSYDHGGRIAGNAWTFGDGGTATETSPTHSYTVTATTQFTVTLTVTDNKGATDIESTTILLDPTAANQSPKANFTSWCYGDGCIFTSTSTDAAPGAIFNYAWNFGDGATAEWRNWIQEHPFFPKNLETHVYTVSAKTSFTVTLTVTDNEGATAVATTKITLTPLPPAAQGCYTSGRVVECVLDIPARSILKNTLLGVNCELVEKLSTPPPVGDTAFLSVCNNKPGDAIGIFGGTFDEAWVYETGTQARIWFTQGLPKPGRTLNPPAGQLTGNFPDWTLSFEDGDHPDAPGEPDFTDVVVGVHATTR
jgi:PKD repeat protein